MSDLLINSSDSDSSAEKSYTLTFYNAFICNKIFQLCSPLAIIRLRRTCKAGRHAVDHYVAQTYDFTAYLGRFFANPHGFRELQASTGAVISGSSALQFMNRQRYDDSDLDIYVTSEYAYRVCEWILFHSGKTYSYHSSLPISHKSLEHQFKYMKKQFSKHEARLGGAIIDKNASDWNNYRNNRVFAVMAFRCLEDENPLDVQVIVSTSSPAASVLSFHSS